MSIEIAKGSLSELNENIKKCTKCPRLVEYTRKIAKEKTKRYRNEKYWGKPLPGFGDFDAELLIIGLAPAAHGGNRTGRMFTGDSSGDWLAKVLYKNGFANSSVSRTRDDDFELNNAYITAVIRCAPPQNKPLREELANCQEYLSDEINLLKNLRVILCLGRIAFESCRRILEIKGKSFSHGNSFKHKSYVIMCSYHPSRQNTQTKRLEWFEWNKVFFKIRKILDSSR